MTAPPMVHLLRGPSWLVSVACGIWADCWMSDQVSRHRSRVTCKRCRRTKVWREAQG